MFFTDGKRRKKTHIPTTFFEPQILFSRTRNFYNSPPAEINKKRVQPKCCTRFQNLTSIVSQQSEITVRPSDFPRCCCSLISDTSSKWL